MYLQTNYCSFLNKQQNLTDNKKNKFRILVVLLLRINLKIAIFAAHFIRAYKGINTIQNVKN